MSQPRDLQHEFYDMLMESQYWLPETMLTYQRSQLAQLLRHARTNVPFYEQRLDPVFTPSGDIDWDRWHEIPIARRSDLVRHKEAMRARQLPPGHGPVRSIQSSGSTGHPIEALVTYLSKLSSDAAAWRSGSWHKLDYGQTLCIRNGSEADIVPPNALKLGPWGPSWDTSALSGRSFRMTRAWPTVDQLELLHKIDATYLAIGGTKSGYILAREAERRGVHHALSRIMVNGEEVSEEDRLTCRRVFGAEIIDLYSSKEGGHMAHPCPSGAGYHVNSERVLIELLDDDDRPVPVGLSGRVVVTTFYSTAQPLIRYDHGDLATWGEKCRCGRHLPLLRSIDGRTGTMFHHPDGRQRARGMPMSFLSVLGASMWQLAQIGPLDYEIRYVPVSADALGDEARVAQAFRDNFFDDAQVSFRRVPEIPLTTGGKYMEYVNEVDLATSFRAS